MQTWQVVATRTNCPVDNCNTLRGTVLEFGLRIWFDVQIHIESFSEGPEEVGNEFQSLVRCHVTWDTVLQEYMQDEQAGDVGGSDRVIDQDEDALLSEATKYHKDCSGSQRRQQLLNEIHGDGIPRLLRYRKVLRGAVRLVTLRLRMQASSA
jgi:hypothetical protein